VTRVAQVAARAASVAVLAGALLTTCTVATWNDAAAAYCIARLENPGRSSPRLAEVGRPTCERLYAERDLPQFSALMIVSGGSLYFVPHGTELVSRGEHRLTQGAIVSETAFNTYAARVALPADMGHLVDVEAEPGGLLLIGWDKDYRLALSGRGSDLRVSAPVAAPALERDRSRRSLDDYSCNDFSLVFPDPARGVMFVSESTSLHVVPLGAPYVVERRRRLTPEEMNTWRDEPIGVLASARFSGGVDHLTPLRQGAYFVDGGLENAAVKVERTGGAWRFGDPMRVPRPLRIECLPRALIGLVRERLGSRPADGST
jgi:hypothetical protein